jgi:hypothetical protein
MFDLDLCVSELYCGVMATNATRKNLVKLMVSWGSILSCLLPYLSYQINHTKSVRAVPLQHSNVLIITQATELRLT